MAPPWARHLRRALPVWWRSGRWVVVVLVLAVAVVPAMLWSDALRARVTAVREAQEADLHLRRTVRLARMATGEAAPVPTLLAALKATEDLPTPPSAGSVHPEVVRWRAELEQRIAIRCMAGNPNLEPVGDLAEACRHAADALPSPRGRLQAATRLGAYRDVLWAEARAHTAAARPIQEWVQAASAVRGLADGMDPAQGDPLRQWADSIGRLAGGLTAVGLVGGVAIDTVVTGWTQGWKMLPPLRMQTRGDTLVLQVPRADLWYYALLRHRDREFQLRGAGVRVLRLQDSTGVVTVPPAGDTLPSPARRP